MMRLALKKRLMVYHYWRDNMVGNSDLMDYAKKFLGLEVTQDISQDLSQIGDIEHYYLQLILNSILS